MTDFTNRKVIISSDGSSTLQLNGLDEHYHSTHGALQESRHVFIQNGVLAAGLSDEPINIMEVGLGTALNAFLAMQYAVEMKQNISYFAIEPFPLNASEYNQLNFAERVNTGVPIGDFKSLHTTPWEIPVSINPYFSLHKSMQMLHDTVFPTDTFHLVFFDAFAPEIQPAMWTPDIFQRIYESMKPGGILVTYCAKGIVRRAMKSAGFEVQKLPGPPGKREMTRAVKR